MFEVILFDLGRVVIGLGESPLPKMWLSGKDPFTLSNWFNSEVGRQFETGEIPAPEFASRLKTELELDVTAEEIIHEFTRWPTNMFPKIPDILDRLRGRFHLAVLSNTNELHYPRLMDEYRIGDYFDTVFFSHLMHCAKPDSRAYQYVLDALNVEPEKVLFLDDNEDNVKAAQAMGIESVQVCGEEEVLQALINKGVM